MSATVLTIGNFDGVHLGHRAILDTARRLADQRGAAVRVLTFDPHPAAVLRPEHQPPRLLPLDERLARLRRAGADDVRVLEPAPDLLATEPEAFIEDICSTHHPLAVVEGENFRFGKARRGDLDLLRRLGDRLGFELHVQPPVTMRLTSPAEVRVSSTLVRRLVGHGRVFDAAAALDEPFSLTAPVVRGEQRGRTLDIPTANLDPDALADYIVPADGVYAGYAEVLISEAHPGVAASAAHESDQRSEERAASSENGVDIHQPPSPHSPLLAPRSSSFPAAISVGVKPTFGRTRLAVEAHLLDYTPESPDDLYGRTLRLTFTRWLRDQYRFPGPDALRRQLRRDIDHAREMIQLQTA